jgi:hypothetical protein
MMKKYLAVDIEIAKDLGALSFQNDPPRNEEVIEVSLIDGWEKGVYREGGVYLAKSPGTLILPDITAMWRPIDNNDWKRFRPLGITCAAAVSSDGGLWNWYAHDVDRRFTDKMSREDCELLVFILLNFIEKGYTLLTWNGLGFDFDVLSEESGMYIECKELALNHIDMMFHFHCEKGHRLGLDDAAKGMELPGKPEGMTGAKAPELWAKGEYHKVLDYVSWDVRNTLDLAQAVDAVGRLDWTARSGNPNSWECSEWLTVKEAMMLVEPDTSWMTDPWPRSKFYEWTGHKPEPILPLPTRQAHPGDYGAWDDDEDDDKDYLE